MVTELAGDFGSGVSDEMEKATDLLLGGAAYRSA
ncbi:MAG: hypothetical protein QOF33_1841, partial [Thermomicrobiales bacterium]|nr:hypothetical protein [Thermomicrobiales bacterium]